MSTEASAQLIAHTDHAMALVQSLIPLGVAPEVASAWAAELHLARSRIARKATQVALVGHLPGDLARGFQAIYEHDLLPQNADAHHGRLLRVVYTRGDPELEEHAPNETPWHWSTAHPDPVPPLLAQATGLQAERAILSTQDDSALATLEAQERALGNLQQEVFRLSRAVQSAGRTARHAEQEKSEAEQDLAAALRDRAAVAERLPGALHPQAEERSHSLSAALLAPFHPRTLDELDQEDATVAAAHRMLAEATARHREADEAHQHAKVLLNQQEAQLRAVRQAIATSTTLRDTLHTKAVQLSRKRLALARQMDHASEARRATLADDLAARLHGAPHGRLRLRWPHGGLDKAIISLVAPGSHADDPAVRNAADAALAGRADALVVCASRTASPDPHRVVAIRRMAKTCPLVALLFWDGPFPEAESATPDTRAQWAHAFGIPREQLLAVSVETSNAPAGDSDELKQRARRERRVLGRALLTTPPVARAAGVAAALRSSAALVETELQRHHQVHEDQLGLLEAQRIQFPADFIAQQRSAALVHLPSAVQTAREQTRAAFEHALKDGESSLAQAIWSCTDIDTLEVLRGELPSRLESVWKAAVEAGNDESHRAEAHAAQDLLDFAITPLAERVRLAHRASRPPGSPARLESDEALAARAVLEDLRADLAADRASAAKSAMVAGGALGVALLGPLGAVLGAGAGAIAHKWTTDIRKRQQTTLERTQDAFREVRPALTDHVFARMEGADARITAALDTALRRTIDQYMDWWAEQRTRIMQIHQQVQRPLSALERVRTGLLDHAVEVEAVITCSAHRAGVVLSADQQASAEAPTPPLIPPPPTAP